MSQAVKLSHAQKLALCHEIARRGVGPIAPVAQRILYLWDRYWSAEAPDPAARPIAPEGPRDPTVCFDHRKQPRRVVSLNTTPVARDEDGHAVMLADRLTEHGVITPKNATSVAWRAEAAAAERIHGAQFAAAYHRALASIEPWARELLDLVAAGKSKGDISAATGWSLRTLSRRTREAENLLRTRILWPNGPPSSTDIIGASCPTAADLLARK